MAGLTRSTSRPTASFRTTCMNACALPALKFCIIWARKSVLHCNLHRLIAFLSNCVCENRYQHPFRLPAGTWQTLRLPWPGFIRTRRGKELATQHQLDPSNIIRLLRSQPQFSAVHCLHRVTPPSAMASALLIARKGRLKCSCSGCRVTGCVGQ